MEPRHWEGLAAAYGVLATLLLVGWFVRSALLLRRAVPIARGRPPELGWDEAVSCMGTGDALFVHSPCGVTARTVQTLGTSYFNHVAVVVRLARGVHVLECSEPALRFVPLAAWRREYAANGARCVWRKLLWRRPADRTVSVHGAAADLLPALGARPYASLLEQVLRRTMPAWLAPSHTRRANCVETVCDVLRALGVLDPGVDTRRWTPDDLADEARWRDGQWGRAFVLRASETAEHQDGQNGVHPDGHPGRYRGAREAFGVDAPGPAGDGDGRDAGGVAPRRVGALAEQDEGEGERGQQGLDGGAPRHLGAPTAAAADVVAGAGDEQGQPQDDGGDEVAAQQQVAAM